MLIPAHRRQILQANAKMDAPFPAKVSHRKALWRSLWSVAPGLDYLGTKHGVHHTYLTYRKAKVL